MIHKIYKLLYSNDMILRQISEIDSLMPLEWDKSHDISPSVRELEYSKLKSDLMLNNKICYYNCDNDAVIGFIIFSKIFHDRIKINSLWIHPSFRKNGYATRLKIYTENWCRRNNIKFIQSRVDSKNEKMTKLNKKLGYLLKNQFMEKRLL